MLLPLTDPAAPGIEAEDLVGRAAVTGGRLEVQQMSSFEGAWGGDAQLWWIEVRPGDRLTLPLHAPEAGTWELIGFFTRAPDYGVIRLHVNGTALEPLVDGYHPVVVPTGAVLFDPVSLRAGANEVVVELVGKDERSAGYSDGYLVGIDGFLLRDGGR